MRQREVCTQNKGSVGLKMKACGMERRNRLDLARTWDDQGGPDCMFLPPLNWGCTSSLKQGMVQGYNDCSAARF